jgi:hypothetical protein
MVADPQPLPEAERRHEPVDRLADIGVREHGDH